MAEHPELDALKAVYDYRVSERRFLMERQFAATIQAVTLNVIVTGGSLAARDVLPSFVMWIVLVSLILFNFAALVYLCAKKRSYQAAKRDVFDIEVRLREYCPWLETVQLPDPRQPPKGKLLASIGDGTNIFLAVICFAALCSILAFIYAEPSSNLDSTGQGKASKAAGTQEDILLGNTRSSARAK